MDLTDFGYNMLEIEVLLKNGQEPEVEKAVKNIEQLAENFSLKLSPVRGKVAECIRRNNFVHYLLLHKKKIIQLQILI